MDEEVVAPLYILPNSSVSESSLESLDLKFFPSDLHVLPSCDFFLLSTYYRNFLEPVPHFFYGKPHLACLSILHQSGIVATRFPHNCLLLVKNSKTEAGISTTLLDRSFFIPTNSTPCM